MPLVSKPLTIVALNIHNHQLPLESMADPKTVWLGIAIWHTYWGPSHDYFSQVVRLRHTDGAVSQDVERVVH